MSKLIKIIKEVASEANDSVRKKEKKAKCPVQLNPEANILPPQR